MNRSLYLHGFDDGINAELILNGQETFERHLVQLRSAAATAILFGQQVHLPEQWGSSSLAAWIVAGEICGAYTDLVDGVVLPTQGVNFSNEKLPIKLFMEADNLGSAIAQRYGNPDRLIVGLPHFNAAVSDSYLERRTSFVDAASVFQDPQASPLLLAKAEDKISNTLGVRGAASGLSNIFKYLNRFDRAIAKLGSYDSSLRDQLLTAERLLGSVNSEYRSRYSSDEIEMFFAIARKNGTSLTQPQEIVRTLSLCPDEIRPRLTEVGRAFVHAALAKSMGSSSATWRFNETDDDRSQFDKFLISKVFSGSQSFDGGEIDTDFSAEDYLFSVSKPNFSRIPWEQAWLDILHFSYSDEWEKRRKLHLQRIRELPLEKKWNSSTWDELFEFLNREIEWVIAERRSDTNAILSFRISEKIHSRFDRSAGLLMASGTIGAALPEATLLASVAIPMGVLGAALYGAVHLTGPKSIRVRQAATSRISRIFW